MRVDPKHLPRVPGEPPPVVPPPRGGRATGPEGAGDSRPSALPPSPSDHLALSEEAREFQRLRPRLEALPGTGRAERVAELKALVSRGDYAVEGERVADAMLNDEAALLMLGLGRAQ